MPRVSQTDNDHDPDGSVISDNDGNTETFRKGSINSIFKTEIKHLSNRIAVWIPIARSNLLYSIGRPRHFYDIDCPFIKFPLEETITVKKQEKKVEAAGETSPLGIEFSDLFGRNFVSMGLVDDYDNNFKDKVVITDSRRNTTTVSTTDAVSNDDYDHFPLTSLQRRTTVGAVGSSELRAYNPVDVMAIATRSSSFENIKKRHFMIPSIRMTRSSLNKEPSDKDSYHLQHDIDSDSLRSSSTSSITVLTC